MSKSKAHNREAPSDNTKKWAPKFIFVARYLPILIEAYDENNVCVFWNETAATVSGYSSKEIEGQFGVDDLIYPDENLRGHMTHIISIRGYDFKPVEWTMTSKDGRKHLISWFNLSKLYRPVEQWWRWSIGLDLTPRMEAEAALGSKNMEFEKQSKQLTEINTTLNVLLETQQEEKKNLIADFVSNQEKLIIPFLEKLKLTRLAPQQEALVDIVIENVHTTTNSLGGTLSHIRHQLTFIEFEVATMIARSKTTQEIANFMNLAPSTVGTHRNNIRQKLGLINKRVRLVTYLRLSFRA